MYVYPPALPVLTPSFPPRRPFALGGDGVGAASQKLGLTLLAGLTRVAVFIGLARYALPWVIRHPAISKNRELPILFAIIAGVGSAWAALSLNLSPALGDRKSTRLNSSH